jgi:hypothetical protein
MKKIIFFIILGISVIACKKDNHRDEDGQVRITGKIASDSKGYGNDYNRKGASLTDAARVVVFTGESYSVSEIKDNSFSLNAPVGSATALIFVDSENRYIGNLTVSGLNILPLINLSDGDNTVIDLSTLTLFETSVIPANNPIGNEIRISQEDVEMLREIGSYFEALSKNLDSDNDGILDVFAKKDIRVNSEFDVRAGVFGLNGTPAVRLASSQLELTYGMRIAGWKPVVPQTVNMSLTGPEGNPYTDIFPRGYQYNDGCECFNAFFGRQSQYHNQGYVPLPFGKGIYSFSLDGINNHTLYYSSISAQHFLMLAVPVLITNSEGNVTRVEIEYMLPDGTPVDHSKYFTTLAIQFKRTAMEVLHQEGSIFDLQNRLPDFENVAISVPLKIDDVTDIDILYTDLVGNIYAIGWSKP